MSLSLYFYYNLHRMDTLVTHTRSSTCVYTYANLHYHDQDLVRVRAKKMRVERDREECMITLRI